MSGWVDPERNILEDACVYLTFHLFQVFNTGRPTHIENWMNQSWSSTHICNHTLDHFNLILLLPRVIMGSWVFLHLHSNFSHPDVTWLCVYIIQHCHFYHLAKPKMSKKKGGTWMDFSSSLRFYESDLTFQRWVSSINSICDVCTCEKIK